MFQDQTEKVVQKNRFLPESQRRPDNRRKRPAQLTPTSLPSPSHGDSSSQPSSSHTSPAHHHEQADEEAVAKFIDKYVIYPCVESSSSGFLEHLPSLYKEVNVQGRYALRHAVQAASFADMSGSGCNDASYARALESYGLSLVALERSLSTPGKEPDDYDLMTVVVLDLFEVRFGTSFEFYSMHVLIRDRHSSYPMSKSVAPTHKAWHIS